LPDFASNDYLGLARSALLLQTTQTILEKVGRIGSTGSRLVTGNSLYTQALEEYIAQFHGSETALLFGSGYMANMGLLSALDQTIYFDTHVHPSVKDGICLSRQKSLRLRHNDLNHLEWRLKKGVGIVCVNSIYSTDGSRAPLQQIQELTERYGCSLIVDEAHAIGIYGKNGRGLAPTHVFARVITFSKALGCYGGAVLCSHALKSRLLNRARPCIYSTALSYPLLAAIQATYALFPQMDKERALLHELMWGESHIAVIPYQEQLTPPFALAHLRPPTVAKPVWRISLHAYNTFSQVRRLTQWIASLSPGSTPMWAKPSLPQSSPIS